jgi:hypothetical protein
MWPQGPMRKEEFAMRSRLAVLLVLACVLITAPAAMACEKCQFALGSVTCVETARGWVNCEVIDVNWCNVSISCGFGLTEPEPLAAEFTVASVERLDQPQAAASETLVASLETPACVTHR